MLYMVTFTINIPPMLAYIPYMDPMGYSYCCLAHATSPQSEDGLPCRLHSTLTPTGSRRLFEISPG